MSSHSIDLQIVILYCSSGVFFLWRLVECYLMYYLSDIFFCIFADGYLIFSPEGLIFRMTEYCLLYYPSGNYGDWGVLYITLPIRTSGYFVRFATAHVIYYRSGYCVD